jgi:hypothetical protein
MDQRKSGIPLLASFPDLSEQAAAGSSDDSAGLLKSSGRIIGQAMSAKLLAGIALFLLVGAVLPFCLKSVSRDLPLGDSRVASSPKSGKTGVTSTTDSPILTPTRRPAVHVAVAKERTPSPIRPTSGPKVAPPMMSSWPAPAPTNFQSEDEHEASPASFERPVPARPTEYQADTRAGSLPENDREIRR